MIAHQSKTSIMARDQLNRNSPAAEDTAAKKKKYKVRKYEKWLLVLFQTASKSLAELFSDAFSNSDTVAFPSVAEPNGSICSLRAPSRCI